MFGGVEVVTGQGEGRQDDQKMDSSVRFGCAQLLGNVTLVACWSCMRLSTEGTPLLGLKFLAGSSEGHRTQAQLAREAVEAVHGPASLIHRRLLSSWCELQHVKKLHKDKH